MRTLVHINRACDRNGLMALGGGGGDRRDTVSSQHTLTHTHTVATCMCTCVHVVVAYVAFGCWRSRDFLCDARDLQQAVRVCRFHIRTRPQIHRRTCDGKLVAVGVGI